MVRKRFKGKGAYSIPTPLLRVSNQRIEGGNLAWCKALVSFAPFLLEAVILAYLYKKKNRVT
uniref:Uncharacterized protein n=1 Tax=Oryza punctata TaxID=4537 RepID=A0A0E0KLK5_ORYPU